MLIHPEVRPQFDRLLRRLGEAAALPQDRFERLTGILLEDGHTFQVRTWSQTRQLADGSFGQVIEIEVELCLTVAVKLGVEATLRTQGTADSAEGALLVALSNAHNGRFTAVEHIHDTDWFWRLPAWEHRLKKAMGDGGS